MFRFAGALALAATAVSAQLPIDVAQVIDNPGGACQECRFHPSEARASSESGNFRGKVNLEIDGTQANGEYLISSGSVKVTVYEVGVQHKVAEHSFDYWTCPRAPADCDACVGTYDSGEFIQFDASQGARCSTQEDFLMKWTMEIPPAQATGHFTLSIVAQPARSQHEEGKLNAVWELQFIAEMETDDDDMKKKALKSASAEALPISIGDMIDNPGGACSTCKFTPTGIEVNNADGELKGATTFTIVGVNNAEQITENLIPSGSVKITVYEIGVQRKVAEHSFDYWICPRPPADCDACVGSYDSGEYVMFDADDGERCAIQKNFVMQFTMDVPAAQRSGAFTFSIVAQPARAQHEGGQLNAVWELNASGPEPTEDDDAARAVSLRGSK